jgi:protein-S-isoprenylcysteine O-methyltransferase Ste14
MARPGFKRWWTQVIPAPIERSSYVLITSLLLVLLFWQWRPLPTSVWELEGAGALILIVLSWIGWLTVLVSTLMIDHFDLFGLRQVYLYWSGQPYTAPEFQTSGLYQIMRHPIMAGFLIAFWATPSMSVGHLVFASATSAYILIAIQLEEKDLMRLHGTAYEQYRRQVSMLLPLSRAPKT